MLKLFKHDFLAVTLTASLLIGSLTSLASAGEPFRERHPRRAEVNRREARQNNRINQGVKNGKLTADQAGQLKATEAQIKSQERADVKANGGYLTQPEQKQLNQELNAQSKTIYQEKHPAAGQ